VQGAIAKPPADAERGRAVFAAKHCASCHVAGGLQGVGRALERLRRPQGAYELTGRLWNHAPAMFTDDRWCAAATSARLCHEAARVKPRETVTFGKVTVPHARHGRRCAPLRRPSEGRRGARERRLPLNGISRTNAHHPA
jgi:cytochrome c